MSRQSVVGVMERRLLISYRADADVVAALLPGPFHPQLVDGSAVVGLCMVSLAETRPSGWPRTLGIRSENAAHRIAVEWDGPDGAQHGVFIVRRDSASRSSVALGGRLYPGVLHRADFAVDESMRDLRIRFASRHDATSADVAVRFSGELGGSLFRDVADASRFFQAGSIGLSLDRRDKLEGWTLHADEWSVQPVDLHQVESSYFDDTSRFPAGSIELDSGVVMHDIPVRWHRVTVPRALEAAIP